MKRALLALAFLVVGCSEAMTTFPVKEDDQEELSAEAKVNIVRMSSKNISGFQQSGRIYHRTNAPSNTDWKYLIGVGDLVSVIVFEHPELTLPETDSDGPNGFAVQEDGTFYFPFIGDVNAAGKSVQDVRNAITQKLAAFVNEPQVAVRVSAFNSQNIVVSGEVPTPNRQALTTVPLTLLQAVNSAGGWTDEADVSRISLRRGGRTFRVDLLGFLEGNISQNNPVLEAGDVVHIPEIENQEAFVMGEALRNMEVDVSSEQVSLTEAVNEAGGPRQVRSDARGVFVFRQMSGVINVYQFDTTTPEGWLLGTKFTLQPQDVIFITRSPLQHWNDTINQLLPTVSAVSSLETLQRNF